MENEEVAKSVENCTAEIIKKADNLEAILNDKSFYGNLKRIMGNHWLLFILVILLGISISLNISRTIVDSEGLVIGFIGVLATFIVVSHFIQVKEVKSDLLTEIYKIKDSLYAKTKEFEDKLDEEFVKKNDTKIIEYKLEMYYNMLEGYIIFYNGDENKNKSFLNCSMRSLNYYNKINEILKNGYSFEMITLFVKHLSSVQIAITESEKNAFLAIAYSYKGNDQKKIIDFILNIKTT
ncbi:MAG: hypothetical protein EZS26_000788 [Candidatus Ordinivivax streblomastigis]|uniref:Uncharacterized protein n=1 Tax=Candidatus Ordinivivax streblomastigis TaxID=2540710 RepID=A0A5M8P3X1_9BACT|nr:MAG: hypothetical protein EZS26_000788 [Candidatus Ordinivivax streblomastigis]